MAGMLSIGFEFNGEFYYMFAKIKDQEAIREYQITLMNSKLSKILSDSIILKELNGYLTVSTFKETMDQKGLKICIAKELSAFLHVPFININVPTFD